MLKHNVNHCINILFHHLLFLSAPELAFVVWHHLLQKRIAQQTIWFSINTKTDEIDLIKYYYIRFRIIKWFYFITNTYTKNLVYCYGIIFKFV